MSQQDDVQEGPSTSTDGTKPVSAILDGTFFSILSQTPDGKVQAECKLCTKKKAVISGTLLATSHFKTHLKRLHPDSLDDFERHKTECRPNYSGKKINTPIGRPAFLNTQ
ncbi:hypothetical protein VZT92_022906 [Zoarces viviparus]|uniref:BED-type domain-containing protein n=1 Tax=Zoarces viviparus TaxID=48416 RepID=A0AAW1E507_ZOAVI